MIIAAAMVDGREALLHTLPLAGQQLLHVL
jgi:hypothetical protein